MKEFRTMPLSEAGIAFYPDQVTVGHWVMPGSLSHAEIRFMCQSKPNWLHRFFMRLLLGWKWVDQ